MTGLPFENNPEVERQVAKNLVDTPAAMIALICGGRTYWDRNKLFATLNHWQDLSCATFGGPIHHVIEGGANGADHYAREWALSRGLTVTTYPARWNSEGKAAGPLRNQRMIDLGKPDLFVPFPGGTGTADMIARAVAAGFAERNFIYGIPFYQRKKKP